MRFRAVVSEVSTFVQIVQSISKLSKKCILKFSADKMHLICHDETEGGVQVWSQVNQDLIFSSYRIESNQANEIHISILIQPLLTVLKSALALEGKGEVVVKLAKRPVGQPTALTGSEPGAPAVMKPMLVWEIGGDSRLNRPPPLSHELHIKVLKTPEVEQLKEPLCPEPDIHIVLPPLSSLRTVTDHLSRLSSHVSVSANNLGELKLEAGRDERNGVEVRTSWKGLNVPKVNSDSQSTQDRSQPPPGHFFNTLVSIKSLLRFLNAHCIQGSTIACICENHSLIIYLYIGDMVQNGGVLTFFIPAVILDEDD
ncbi:Checkpoint 9-1-1 complex, HUS1 component [Phaffia rhodozyma]|uniref:Checkpoint protein n=1 Tax=Phaffia rhodozyma TaxID=264483 RepID=A0A0F7SHH7_PHARH|nr:Checkpoint 9-1-1 complex, HUS1 component [Phaffia rhodozyma]